MASSSPYRQDLLKRLNLPFKTLSPDIDESKVGTESLVEQVLRLAREKAMAVATTEAESLIIGSDQLASCEDILFGKPGGYEKALEQLLQMCGKTLVFHTGLCLINTSTGAEHLDCIVYSVQFREYTEEEIVRYLHTEQPYNCAGSFKSEGLGIALVESMTGKDPSALIGLPLIRLAAMLRQEGCSVP